MLIFTVCFFAAQLLGEDPTHKGQLSVLCITYDYGATPVPSKANTWAGLTPNLPYFPPPPPSCGSYPTAASCPDRCFWNTKDGCATAPPIPCGNNIPGGGGGNNALCVHVEINTTAPDTTWSYLADQGSYNQTVVFPPAKSFQRDLWYSMWDGEVITPPSLHPFRYCVQYGSGNNDEVQFAVCLSLVGGAFDLQGATTSSLVFKAEWESEDPFVAKVVISDNTTLAAEAEPMPIKHLP